MEIRGKGAGSRQTGSKGAGGSGRQQRQEEQHKYSRLKALLPLPVTLSFISCILVINFCMLFCFEGGALICSSNKKKECQQKSA